MELDTTKSIEDVSINGDDSDIYPVESIEFEGLNFWSTKMRDIWNSVHFVRGNSDKYLYLMQNTSTKLTKIGISHTPKGRAKHISNASGIRHKIIYYCKPYDEIEPSAYHIEQQLHIMLDERRFQGEWFYLSEAEIWRLVDWLEIEMEMEYAS